MRASLVRYAVTIALVIAAGAACSDSSGSGASFVIAIVSGDNQSGNAGLPLAQPLVVRVTNSSGGAVEATTVTWTVTAGAATTSPASSQSDAAGLASTAVTLGSIAGALTITAGVSGGQTVTFTLTVVGAAALTKLGGDNQTGPVGGQLPESLRVNVLGTDGQPFRGGAVDWALTAGTGSTSPTRSLTDANGDAATIVTLGAAGNATIRASAGSATPATFQATAVPACQYVAPYALGQTVNGTLSTFDCPVNIGGANYFYDFYGLTVAAQQSLSASMSSSTFDTWLDMFKSTGVSVALNDDSAGTTTNSHIEGFFGSADYVLGANSFNPMTTGAYTLRSAPRPATIALCRIVFTTRGVSITESVDTTDCADNSTGSPFYSDRLIILLDAGDQLQVRMQSTALNPSMFLYDLVNDVVVAQNDDSAAGNPTAYISYVSAAGSVYFIDLGTATTGETGAYTVTITGPVLSAAPGAEASGQRTAPLVPLGPMLRAKAAIAWPAAVRARVAAGEGAGAGR